jgi:predicted PurR-regulated permease PerM
MMGAVMALLAQPVYRQLLRRRLPAKVAAALVTLGLVLLVVTPLLVCTMLAVRQAITVERWVTSSGAVNVDELLTKIASWGPVALLVDDPQDLRTSALEYLEATGKHASTFVLDAAKRLPEGGLHLFLACLACFFFIIDGRRLVGWLGAKLPLDRQISRRLVETFRGTAISVVWASMTAAAVQAALTFVVFLALRIPAASLALAATFVLAWVPVIGSLPVWAAGGAYLAVTGNEGRLVALVVLGFIASGADHFVRPWVLRGRGEMHPLVSIIAILGGIQAFGPPGVLFGPVLAAVVITVLQMWPVVGRDAGLQFPEAPHG